MFFFSFSPLRHPTDQTWVLTHLFQRVYSSALEKQSLKPGPWELFWDIRKCIILQFFASTLEKKTVLIVLPLVVRFVGMLACGPVLSIAEMSALIPLSGGIVRHAELLVDPALAFANG